MTTTMLAKIISIGDKYGSAFREILDYYKIANFDLSKISDDMAQKWLDQKGCGDNVR